MQTYGYFTAQKNFRMVFIKKKQTFEQPFPTTVFITQKCTVMKKFSVCVFLVAAALLAKAQEKITCCVPSATEAYAMNASVKDFRMSHPDPLPFVYTSEKGKDITYATPDGATAHAFEIKAAKPTSYYLFVIHEWYGLNDYIKQEAETLANETGINVIALDLYDHKVAANRDDAAKYMQSVKTERAISIIKGAYAYAGSNARVFTIGWCFGGGWSLQASIEGGSQAAGCIMYYGQPEKNVDRLKTLRCNIIGFFGNQDQWPSPAVVDQFEKDAAAAGVKLSANRYDAGHGFANPSNPSYNTTARNDAHTKALAFIRERMK